MIFNLLKKIWHDSVGSNLIATIIAALGTALFKASTNYLDGASLLSLALVFGLIFIVIIISVVQYKKYRKRKEVRLIQEEIRKISDDAIELNDLYKKAPHIERIGIIGLPEVGKTTLIKRMMMKSYRNYKETVGVRAYIHNFSSKDDKYAAILDGAGQYNAQQNAIASASNILVILLDHNMSATNMNIDHDRIEEHRKFVFQIYGELEHRNVKPRHIILLVNKKDLWEKSTPIDQKRIMDFAKEQKENLEDKLETQVSVVSTSIEKSSELTEVKLIINSILQ